jgi:outer membrane receptor protein involved in Fe transport
MATVIGDYNTLIGHGASIPSGSPSNNVVLGGAASVVYMGGAQAGAAGVTVTTTALTLWL